MSGRLRRQREIDSTLRALGSTQPPEGMERRIHARLQAPPRRFPAVYSISAAAMALGILIVAAILNPSGRSRLQRDEAPLQSSHPRPIDQNLEQQILTRPEGAFGAASAIHLPNHPTAVEPAPIGVRRGHTRSLRNESTAAAKAAPKSKTRKTAEAETQSPPASDSEPQVQR